MTTALKTIADIPSHVIALVLIILGGLLEAFSDHIGPAAKEAGTAMLAAGLAIYRQPDLPEPDTNETKI